MQKQAGKKKFPIDVPMGQRFPVLPPPAPLEREDVVDIVNRHHAETRRLCEDALRDRLTSPR